MAGESRSRWRRHADAVIANVLDSLPAGASPEQKRAACNEAYPFGERAMLPYKHWLAALRSVFGGGQRKKKMARVLPMPAPQKDATLFALLIGYRENPKNDARRLVIADWLDEHDDPRADRVRRIEPTAEDVRRLVSRHWMRSSNGEGRWYPSAEDVTLQLTGQLLIVDPEIKAAAAMERCAQTLALFGGRIAP